MSFKAEKREQIKRYLLEKIDILDNDIVKKTATAFDISSNTVYRYIRELIDADIIKKAGKDYKLVETSYFFTLDTSTLLEEDRIYANHIEDLVGSFPDNVRRIWGYSFMEMMNNAIEHSEATEISCAVFINYLSTIILIQDNGVGIFNKIQKYYNYDSLDDAVKELFKGKLTTDAQNHSGEGIFFTSRALDMFAAISSGRVFTHNKFFDKLERLDDINYFQNWRNKNGTMIYMSLSNWSNRILSEVFDEYADVDGGFMKTKIPIKNFFESFPVSRSQAKRLCHRFESFTEVILDFEKIDEIGQGFAHEIFVVFKNRHPDVELIPINANNQVQKMINHVLFTAQ